jgi:tetratricopeptide (TPR) repeat protein
VILPWKKSEPPPAFVADPAKAARYAEKAREAMRKGEWTYSLTMFGMSVKFDPFNLVVHSEMYDAAMAHHNAGGKSATSSDVKMIDGSGLVDRFAVSEYQWFCNIRDAGLALACLESAAKAGLPDFGQWAAKSAFGAVNLAQNAKPNKKLWLRAKDALAGVEAWEQALACGEAALAMDASDGALQSELRQLQAALAIKRGGYNENLGKEGAFLTRVKDADKQAELQAADSLSGAGGKDQLQMEVAKREFEEKPQSPEAVLRYAQLLRRGGTPEGEALAIEVYTTGFKNIGEYRFKMEADNIRILRARRKLEAIKAAADAGDAKAATQHAAGLKQVQEFEAACFTERASKYPTDRGVKYDLGRLLFELGRYEDAMKSLQEAKDEGKYRVIAAHLLGRCFVQEGWHGEAVGEFKEALAALDVTTGDREMDIRYDLMVTLIELAKAEKSTQHAKDAQELCSAILRKDIGFRDIRARRKETDELVRQLS